MNITVKQTSLHVLNMWTRMPFKYGIATLTALPHVFLSVELEIDGHLHYGLAAEGLPPKWFTKDPGAALEDELADMMAVIAAACDHASNAGAAATVFELWRNIYDSQEAWARHTSFPALLWAFGVTVVERAIIDAFCRATGMTFANAVSTNALGIPLDAIHGTLSGVQPADLLPPQPIRRLSIRHTVGLADPLVDSEIRPADHIDDGLPQSLEACIRTYGLTHFKIKVPQDMDHATDRMKNIAAVLTENCPTFACTFDGNEFFQDAEAFRQLWQQLNADQTIGPFIERSLLFVEQPIHRDMALGERTEEVFGKWTDRPPMIIDESDGELTSLPRALQCGYNGTSHKNCKGVLKGIANRCLIEHYRRTDSANHYEMSCEDLANVGPIALLQDLAVVATLGISHAERNGHHYFAGLSALPIDLQRAMLETHGDLYHQDKLFPTLSISDGQINLTSVVASPFGFNIDMDPTRFTPIDDWRFESLASKPD